MQRALILRVGIFGQSLLSILDSSRGKIIARIEGIQLCNGALISYVARTDRSRYTKCESVEILEVPLLLAHDDIVFLHAVLEICDYCMPLENHMPGVFNLIECLYTMYNGAWDLFMKKIFLCKLLLGIGLSPDSEEIEQGCFDSIINLRFIDFANEAFGAEETMFQIDRWIVSCLSAHPSLYKFNTLNFFNSE